MKHKGFIRSGDLTVPLSCSTTFEEAKQVFQAVMFSEDPPENLGVITQIKLPGKPSQYVSTTLLLAEIDQVVEVLS